MNQATLIETVAELARRQGYLAAVLLSHTDPTRNPHTFKELGAASQEAFDLAHRLKHEAGLFEAGEMVDPFGPEAA